ncbi:MAG: HdeD family acid-resistance protein [Planctomycetota bacterium]|jgi:uncharacterized membrane protein HdeD (DUF308 family)
MKNAVELARNWRWVLGLGCVVLLGGVIGIVAPHFTSYFVVKALGLLFLLGGVAEMGSALQMQGARVVVPTVVAGLLMAVCGGLFIFQTLASVDALTLILGVIFLIQGIGKVVGGFYVKPAPVWGWLLLDGAITTGLGGIVLAGWHDSSFAIIGLLVGISFLFGGTTLISISLFLKRVSEEGGAPAL